ncbi:MAG TPA: YSIRK-type signal peptide-containing protein [Candidatus Limosilactobacillus excrementigallinarum]|nr:YSIRK-type signal peptide-containing protein [Candidatus Limosilactobacillus excrementigallinarum]
MVSKNNRLQHDQWMAKQRPHYGLRKLSFGVASVLLGTTLYFGTNDVAAKAATTDANNVDSVNQVQNTGSAIQQPNNNVAVLNHNQSTADQNINRGVNNQ